MNKIYQKESESVCDYSLPDYLGDVKKILTVTATAVPSGRFVSGGEVNFSGVVCYDILYADSENKLTALTLNSDYDVSVPVDEDSYLDSMGEARVAAASVRLTGPRKMTAKATVVNNIRMSLEDNLEYRGDVFAEGGSPETLNKIIEAEKTVFASSPEREYAEEAQRLDGVTPDEVEILATSGAVRVLESEASDGGVAVRGEIIITAIVRTAEQPPFAIKKVVPFEETVNFDGLNSNMKVSTDGYLTSVTAGVVETEEGCAITVNAISELYTIASENKELSVTCDAYLKNRDTNGTYENFEYSQILSASTAEGKITAEVMRADIGCENARDILKLVGEIKNYEKKLTMGGFTLEGEAMFCGAATEVSEDGSLSYLPVKFTAPISLNVNCNISMPTDASVDCSVTPIDTEVLMDSDRVSVSCLVKVAYRVTKTDSVRRICECNTTGEEEYKNSSSSITVYYPTDEESLFEIAKKFHTTGAKIAQDNSLTQQTIADTSLPVSLSGVDRLIIT